MTHTLDNLSKDALTFAFVYLRRPGYTLDFGGEGAEYRMTPRARAALIELKAAGACETVESMTSIPGRESVISRVDITPHTRKAKINGFDRDTYLMFEKVRTDIK